MVQRAFVFFKEVKSELSQVSWPTWGQLWESTRVVLVMIVLLALVIGFYDLIFARLISWVF